jgi:hypothetical protein
MNHRYPAHRASESGFALISVLALVSLAALTATAFLASARLERQATRPIGETTRLQMTLNTGRECASEVMNRIGEPYWNFVTTYWRPNPADELGYLFVGKPYGSNSLRWDYYCGFTPKQWTNLDSSNMTTRIRATNTICQATYSNEIQTFMAAATSGFSTNPGLTNPTCVQIPLLGGRTSLPVGWVYIKQNIRTNLSSTNTTNVPVARFAYFIEDLGGLIDAERMGGTNSRPTGTNAEEISLTNLAGTTATNISPTTYTSKRPQYLTPGMLLTTNDGFLTNTNDVRYFASRLRYCNWKNQNSTNWDRIPYIPISANLTNGSYYPTNAGTRKYLLTDLTPGGQSKIAAQITNTFPMFTNRAGGMNGNLYVNALAANIVDYADADSSPTPFSVGGINAAGFDAYPLPTIIFDQMKLVGKTLTVATYWQFWNCSSTNSPAVNYACTYEFADTLGSYFTTTNNLVPNSPRMLTNAITNTLAVPDLGPGCSAIVSITNNINLESSTLIPASVPAANVKSIWIDGTTSGGITQSNKFTLTLTGNVISKLMTDFERKAKNLDNGGAAAWSGGMPGLRYDNVAGINTSFKVPPSGDPRMLLYFTNTNANGYLSACDYDQNVEWELGYAQTRKDAFSGAPYSGMPGKWIDGTNSSAAVILGTPNPDTQAPTVGTNSSKSVTFAKLSNRGLYTNICELGNVFDPIQWVSTKFTNPTDWVNCDIDSANTWAGNSMYGGGQTLRIGRPEHSRFAFTNLGGGGNPVPSLGTSAAGLLEIFCTTNEYNWAGKININTAPPPVLAALAGGITLSKDTNKFGSESNSTMISAFTNGVVKFRSVYPFISPSQLAFISANYGTNGWTNSAVWKANAVFSTNTNTTQAGGLSGVTSLNDEGREEWFSKIYNLTCVQSYNYRIYVVAQLTTTNGNPKGAMMRKYYLLHLRNNSPGGPKDNPPKPPDQFYPSVSPVVTYEAFY